MILAPPPRADLPASSPAPGSPRASADAAPFRRLLTITAAAALLLALCEVGLTYPVIQRTLGVPTSAGFFLLLTGNWLPYAAFGAAGLVGVEAAARRLRSHQRHVLWLVLPASLLVTPYTAWLAHDTFSGPNIGSLSSRWVWILVMAAILALAFGAVIAWTGLRDRWRKGRAVVGSIWWVLGASALYLSNVYLPNEYEPLHAALAYAAVTGAVLGAGEIVRFGERCFRRVRPGAIACVLGLTALGSSLLLSWSNRLAWLVWGEAPGSRYVTARLLWNSDAADEPADGSSDAAQATGPWSPQSAKSKAPHIFVFSIDNLQVDHVGAYGYRKRPSTPHIDELAARGALFERAYSYQPQTRVFMTSMLLGRRIPDFGAHEPPTALQELALTRLLKTRDYHILVKGVFELTRYRKFDPKVYLIDTNIERETPELIRAANKIPHIPYEERFRIVDRHLQAAGDKPVFVWLHLLGPHWFRGKFSPSEEFPFGKGLTALYDSAIAGTDVWLRRLQEMAAARLRDDRDVYWIVMSDHGAGLGPARREKGKSVLEGHVHVPLIFAGPGIRVGRIDVPVDSALDSAATILDLAGVGVPPSYDGVSLLPRLREGTGAEELAERVIPLRNGAWTGAVYKQWKYVRYRDVDQLFDLSQDPHEAVNLADDQPELTRRLRAKATKKLHVANRLFKTAAKASAD